MRRMHAELLHSCSLHFTPNSHVPGTATTLESLTIGMSAQLYFIQLPLLSKFLYLSDYLSFRGFYSVLKGSRLCYLWIMYLRLFLKWSRRLKKALANIWRKGGNRWRCLSCMNCCKSVLASPVQATPGNAAQG